MPGCQPGAVQSRVCGTIIYIAVAGDFGVCHTDCYEEDCGKAMFYMGRSGGLSARLFSGERGGQRVGAHEMAKRLGCCWAEE
jgi:hypothetical protein